MIRASACWPAVGVVALGLLMPARVNAWLFHGADPCPRCEYCGGSYSPAHYRFPLLWNLSAHCHGPAISVYPVDRYPHIPAGYSIITSYCPPVYPGLVPSPTPPAADQPLPDSVP